MADFLDEKRSEIDARLKELKPLVEEHDRLQAALTALEAIEPARATLAAAPPRERPPAGRRTGPTGGRRRPQGGATRGGEALALVRDTPGITVAEIAAKMGIKQNYLYRVLPKLARDGLVRKDGRGWHPRQTA